jgi:hypothetical protein
MAPISSIGVHWLPLERHGSIIHQNFPLQLSSHSFFDHAIGFFHPLYLLGNLLVGSSGSKSSLFSQAHYLSPLLGPLLLQLFFALFRFLQSTLKSVPQIPQTLPFHSFQ